MTVQPAIEAALDRLRAGDGAGSVAALRSLCARAPTSLAAHNALGSALGALGQHRAAVSAFRQALALGPDHAQVRCNLAGVLLDSGHVSEARVEFERVIHGESGDVVRDAPMQAYLGLGRAALLLGDSTAASETFAAAAERFGGRLQAHSRRAYASLLDPALSARRVVEIHREYDARVMQDIGAAQSQIAGPPLRPRPRGDRDKVRIGYVSADFREHSVACFIEGVLAAHDRNAVELVLYGDVTRPDATTRALAALSDRYCNTITLSDAQLAEQILGDQIDVLIDLGGHMMPNRLPVFARRPAPVLLSYLGYPGTTGMSVFEGRITDAWADPSSDASLAGPEPLLCVDRGYFAYTAPNDAPEVSVLPARERGGVTFGCFNDTLKLNDTVLQTFACIVTSVPGSRLLLKGSALSSGDVRARVQAALGRGGVAQDRIELLPWSPSRQQHLSTYARVDIALDTFPYAGATTTCEALYMGVPVVTLRADRHAGRMGVSILSSAGLHDWIASNVSQYVELARTRAADLDSLAALRAGLRPQLHASALCDGTRVARFIEQVCLERLNRLSES